MSGDPYPPIGDYALIGDCHSAALVSRECSIDWCCLPRFDSGSAFGRLLDWERGGYCQVAPAAGRGGWDSSREYLEGTLVLQTTLRGRGGEAKVLDCLTVDERARESRGSRLLRVIEGQQATAELDIRIVPRFDYGQVTPWIRREGPGLHSAIGGNDALVVFCDQELDEDPAHELIARVRVGAGDRVRLVLEYSSPERVEAQLERMPDPRAIDRELKRTIAWWRGWASSMSLSSRDESAARRSGIVLKALTYAPTGAIAAAPTTSLPEVIGGARNWDYRYAWVRDSSFSSRAFAELGAVEDADAFRAFIMRSAAGHAEELQIVYGVGGDVSLIEHAAERWRKPDRGIWEWPGRPEHFVHSKVMCWSALDRGIRLAQECMRKAPTRRWKLARDELRRTIERRGYDRKRGVYVQAFDRKAMDGALLLLPRTEFVAWDDERMMRTVGAVREQLDAGGGLLYRYRRKDGLQGQEGAFLCCSFWLAECLARSGNLAEARTVFDTAIASANDLGLLSEEVEPSSGELLGNFPQALTHLSHIDAAIALAETEAAL
ncbi:MAG: glycoside hydrolase family 15 protein [Actinobacteria bacterium]|nr:MAG: glycoside hydrolase family 15 protein [Actinomycetota bacterium]